MTRSSDADALMERWCSELCGKKPNCRVDCSIYWYKQAKSYEHTILMMAESNAKSDLVPVIRCRECKYFRKGNAELYNWCPKNGYKPEENHYCSRAERKTDEV